MLRILRLLALSAGVAAIAGLLAACRPGTAPTPGDPTAGVVWAAAWVAWLLAGYLALSISVCTLAELRGPLGRAGRHLGRLAPRAIHRAVHVLAGSAVAASAIVATSAGALAGPPPPRPALEWPGAATGAVVVNRGDTLWAIAARQLPASAANSRVAALWPRWYAANRAVIGTDPDLIQPGQRLTPPIDARSTP